MRVEKAEIRYTEYQEKGACHREILGPFPFHPVRIRYNLALSLLPHDLTELRTIDFGGGDGAMSTLMANSGAKVVVVDFDHSALSMAKKGDQRLKAVQSKSNLPFRSESADAIVMLETLEHIRDSEEMPALSEAARVLKQDGDFVISVPSSNLAVTRLHYRHYSLDELKEKLAQAGFAVKETIFYRERLTQFAGKKPFGRYIRGVTYGFNWATNNLVNFVRCDEKDAQGFVVLASKA